MGLKRCTKCQIAKVLTHFRQRTDSADGRQSWCRTCFSALDRERAGSDARRKSGALYSRSERGRSLRRKHQRTARYKSYNAQKLRTRLRSDVQFRLAHNLRVRLGRIPDRGPGSAIRDLGCTIAELKLHLERQFQLGMSWQNYGNKAGQWSIDHIKALASFDLTDRKQFLEACHYTNLQPLWHIENIKKGRGVKQC